MKSPLRMPASAMESPCDAQHEVVVVAAQEAGHVDELLDVLLGEDGHAGGDLADERQRARRPQARATRSRARGLLGSRLMSPRRSRLARCACTVEGDDRSQLGADLAHRRRIAVDAHALADELQYLLLPVRQTFHRASSGVEHVFVLHPRVNTCSCQEA